MSPFCSLLKPPICESSRPDCESTHPEAAYFRNGIRQYVLQKPARLTAPVRSGMSFR
jgi:hypothetical protein